jgi:hypothetical protein
MINEISMENKQNRDQDIWMIFRISPFPQYIVLILVKHAFLCPIHSKGLFPYWKNQTYKHNNNNDDNDNEIIIKIKVAIFMMLMMIIVMIIIIISTIIMKTIIMTMIT